MGLWGEQPEPARLSGDIVDLSLYKSALIPTERSVEAKVGFRFAAVLLGLCDWWGSAGHLLAIRRASALRDHGGQVGFPGGKQEVQDPSLAHTALRESQEEIGLDAERVTLLGRLAPVATPSMFWIVPFVGIVDARGWTPQIDPGEVEQLLRLKRDALEAPENYLQQGFFERAGYRVPRHEYRICEPPLWGASAHMVHELMTRFARVNQARVPR